MTHFYAFKLAILIFFLILDVCAIIVTIYIYRNWDDSDYEILEEGWRTPKEYIQIRRKILKEKKHAKQHKK